MTDATGQPAPEAQHPSEPTGPTPSTEPDTDTEVATVYSSGSVSVRRSPRYWRFLVIGAFVGVIAALILTFTFPGSADYSLTQVFGFLLLVCVVVFGAIALVVGLLIDRSMARRTRIVAADRVDVHPAGTPAADAEPNGSVSAEPGESGPPNPPIAEGSGRS
ncbi:DUF2273 domain-containing protein [Plantibacter sp. CFBP 8775]|uniref:DUF2273 domain-containing protein n=1 Tax=Plantibacter sp. CFBP 8775 TaxID=2774038 RepID=UPI001782E60A|nr:hypothetical protein [Plantibacter sp. CFBP 8775]MBD8101848.1 hypothetical protein [Plantibacter sp. CFBP 8775]